jgi:hypothetical protein
MNYLLTGGTGLIGAEICQKLQAAGHTVIILSRQREKVHRRCGLSAIAITDLSEIGSHEHVDVVINLAGAPIADARWSQKRKQVLEESRIDATERLVEWMSQRQKKPAALISGSAVGWYGDQGDTPLNENSDFHDEYGHQLCQRWEQAALRATDAGIRVCIVRTGLVLARQGGMLQRLLLPFKMGLGGPISDGKQYMPWIHLEDIANLFIFLSKKTALEGIFNGTAPTPVTNGEFTQTLASTLKRPAFMRVPACVLRVGLGELSQLLLGGQRALPENARAAGFEFHYTELQPALNDILKP